MADVKRFFEDAKAALVLSGAGAIVLGLLYLQFRIIYDCGFMALFRGAEWWWLFGYCK